MSKLRSKHVPGNLERDFREIGLRVGLEIHRQLETRAKLFCGCPTILSSRPPPIRFERKLRPTQSELGQMDPAALFEFHRGRTSSYEADNETSCLVEMDEEPPHPLNQEAIDTSLMISILLKAVPMDEVHVMRKVVIDGSNTTGFQRTCIIAMDGEIQVNGTRVPIRQISLEEDAGRKIGEARNTVTFHLDRLGVPLIEITTAPVIHTPEDAERVALAIGQILRATKRVKRGLGTIRQDLNISIQKGALVEIKGIQELDLVSKVVRLEVERQLSLLSIADELRAKPIRPEDIDKQETVDVTESLKSSKSKIVQSALQKGGKTYALRLRGFNGYLGRELTPGLRLGTELSKRAAYWGRVGGIFHSDELPAYGIELAEKETISEQLKCSTDDAYVLVADQEANCLDALLAVRERAKEAAKGVPQETRAANPDGTTSFMRPRPGAARMYPETDVPPVQVTVQRLELVRSHVPRNPEELAKEISSKYAIGPKLAEQVISSDHYNLFEQIVSGSKSIAPSYVATVLTESLKSLERDKIPIHNLTVEHLKGAFKMVQENQTAKEAIPEILRWLAQHPEQDEKAAVAELRLGMLSSDEIGTIIRSVISNNKGMPSSKLTGLVMREVRGRADPKLVLKLLNEQAETKAGRK